jgi:hypothetical protein
MPHIHTRIFSAGFAPMSTPMVDANRFDKRLSGFTVIIHSATRT